MVLEGDQSTRHHTTLDQPTLATDFFETSDWSINDVSDLKEVGKGKDTVIYSGICQRLGGRKVAVKVYDRAKVHGNKLRAIKREIAMMMFFIRQKVPHVVEFFGAFVDDNHYYIVMEYCAGGDLLERLLHDKRAFSERRTAVDVALPLINVLKHLHALNIIHRDIKLENIFIDTHGHIKLGDFGLTMCTKQESAISPVGTVEYMAPEVVALPPVDMVSSGKIPANSIKPTTDKVDIWALGVTLFELVTGRLPFEGIDKAEVKANITSHRLSPFPHIVSTQCQDMIRAMLAYAPEDRPSAAELLSYPYMVTYTARLAAQKATAATAMPILPPGKVVNVVVRAGGVPAAPSPISPGPPIGILQVQSPAATSTSSPHNHSPCFTASPTASNSQHNLTQSNGSGFASDPSTDSSSRIAAKQQTGNGWVVLKRVSKGTKTEKEEKSQELHKAVQEGRALSARRSRSWSASDGSQDLATSKASEVGGRGGNNKSRVKRVIQQLFSRKQESQSSNRRVASMPVLGS